MKRSFLGSITGFTLVFLLIGLAHGQPQEEVRNLYKNIAINLVVEPAEDKEGFTIITATERFLVETEVEKTDGRIALSFEGQISLRGSQMVIGDKRLGGDKPFLVSYQIRIRPVGAPKQAGSSFVLNGSAFLEENKQVVIGKSKDVVLKLKISSLE